METAGNEIVARALGCRLYENRSFYINKTVFRIEITCDLYDFTSFKKVRTSNPAKICNMYEAKATRDGDLIYIDFTADRFLYNMIRLIVGTLLMMERNSLAPETLKEILEAKDITKAGSTISPEGLTLVEVIYNNINGESK